MGNSPNCRVDPPRLQLAYRTGKGQSKSIKEYEQSMDSFIEGPGIIARVNKGVVGTLDAKNLLLLNSI